ncbi:GIY-YIG nuclease family protein [Pseudoduganella chitinolytica]|uniref:GIY-YIG nuclease family protein n=1 Tax=Pseudoduganella chitinolytica TaxID=34070 RepID=A0ABY8BFM2_9BURK|nr:GIY-YIG nuclease family protein [Pseudoduganella chitinolytica]WEF34700.1 GIY-YIG nuclease family protein [Pseudoduganella chitinolytica]
MNDYEGEQFETLPFGGQDEWGGAAELEEERGRAGGGRGGRGGMRPGGGRGGGRVVGRPGKPRPPARPPTRPPSRPPRPPGPYWGPAYGGWPVGVMVSDPGRWGAPAPEDPWEPPQDGPPFDTVDLPPAGDDDVAPQDEIPPKLSTVLTTHAPGIVFRDVGTLAAFRKAGKVTGAGIYIIVFRKGGKPMAYVGETDDLQERVRKHMLGGAVLGVSLRNYRLFVAQPAVTPTQRRVIEKAINTQMLLPHNRGETTNQVAEFELQP